MMTGLSSTPITHLTENNHKGIYFACLYYTWNKLTLRGNTKHHNHLRRIINKPFFCTRAFKGTSVSSITVVKGLHACWASTQGLN